MTAVAVAPEMSMTKSRKTRIALMTFYRPTSPSPNGGANTIPLPEFLYRLTKMLSDDSRETIEWVDGRI